MSRNFRAIYFLKGREIFGFVDKYSQAPEEVIRRSAMDGPLRDEWAECRTIHIFEEDRLGHRVNARGRLGLPDCVWTRTWVGAVKDGPWIWKRVKS